MNRREWLAATAAVGLGLAGLEQRSAIAADKKQVLFFTKSSGFEHPMIKVPAGGGPSPAEKFLEEWGAEHGFEVTTSKDGTLFNPGSVEKFDAFVFYTTGDLTQPGTDKQPPMTPAGKQAFLAAIRGGKGFVGIHSATDTFHTQPDPPDRSNRYVNHGAERVDPYVAMIGGEFIRHGKQQMSRMIAADTAFPGCGKLGKGFEMHEEWYSLKEFRDDLHVLLVQETAGMEGSDYQRPPYPATWARMHGKGRVFYTSMGHRDDVWASETFRSVFLGGLAWTLRRVEADVTPNIRAVAPGHAELPPRPA